MCYCIVCNQIACCEFIIACMDFGIEVCHGFHTGC